MTEVYNKGKGAGLRWMREHVDHKGDDCLYWPFSRGDGYGSVSDSGKLYRAHRYMCALVNGEPPTSKHQAAHSCGNGLKGCVNPKHLSWKTNGENQLDRRDHGTKNYLRVGHRGKITPEQDNQIRELAKTKTQMELAEMFGVTRSTIQYRLYGGSYKPRRRQIEEGSPIRGPRGYSRREDGRWWARIKVNGRSIDLGTYKTEDEARGAYETALARAQ